MASYRAVRGWAGSRTKLSRRDCKRRLNRLGGGERLPSRRGHHCNHRAQYAPRPLKEPLDGILARTQLLVVFIFLCTLRCARPRHCIDLAIYQLTRSLDRVHQSQQCRFCVSAGVLTRFAHWIWGDVAPSSCHSHLDSENTRRTTGAQIRLRPGAYTFGPHLLPDPTLGSGSSMPTQSVWK